MNFFMGFSKEKYDFFLLRVCWYQNRFEIITFIQDGSFKTEQKKRRRIEFRSTLQTRFKFGQSICQPIYSIIASFVCCVELLPSKHVI